MRTYPDILPVPTWPDFGMTPKAQAIRTDMEAGAPRSRRFSKAKIWDVDLAFRMTDTESGLFWPWYYDDAWALSGDSESLSAFTQVNLASLTYPATGPDGQAAARLVENTTVSAAHGVTLALAAMPAGGTASLRATVKAGPRGFFQLGFTNWAGTVSTVAINLSTGAFTGGANFLTRAVKNRGNGWWRIEMTAATGTGATTPSMSFSLGSAGTTFSYTGDGTSYLDLCEQQARAVTTADGFLRTDSSGNILGAGAGAAWFSMAVPLGGGMQTRQVQLVNAQGKPLNGGANWINSFKALVQ